MPEHSVTAYKTGIITVESEHFDTRMTPEAGDVRIVSSELDLINDIIDKVLEHDPDVVAGWEVQAASWGYLEARGKTFGVYCKHVPVYDRSLTCPSRPRCERCNMSRADSTTGWGLRRMGFAKHIDAKNCRTARAQCVEDNARRAFAQYV